jgi:hypothetical protein
MTIDLNTLFANIGHLAKVAEDLDSSYQDTEDAVRVFQEDLDAESQEIQDAVNQGIEQGLVGLRGSIGGSKNTLAASPLTRLIIETVHEDVPMLNKTLANALGILLAQMDDSADTLDATTVGFTTVYGAGGSSSGVTGDNYGNGILVITEKRGDAQVNAFILSENLRCAVTASQSNGEATWRIHGEPTESRLSPTYPAGSAVSRNVTSLVGESATNRVLNGTFADEDDNAEYQPKYWIASEATLGTTLQLTDVEVQTVTINGTPTDGHYSLKFTDSEGREYWTDPLAYDATGATVQTALQALPFMGSVTVTTTGTSPNYTHSVVFYGVPNPHELDYDNQLTTDSSGGSPSITIDTVTVGAAEVMRGDRALEIAGDGSENTTIQTAVSLSALSTYCVVLWALCDVAPAAGELTVDLIDSIDGTVLEDDQGNTNSFTVDLTALGTYPEPHTGIFRTPRHMPPRTYLRLKLTTALSSGSSLFLDEVILAPMTELYAGGPFVAAFTGAKNFRVGDTAVVTVLNNREGTLHEWLHRLLNLGASRILFPTASPSTFDDSLIA